MRCAMLGLCLVVSGCSFEAGLRGIAMGFPACGESSSRPLDHAEVAVSCAGRRQATTTTDDEGRFFMELDAPSGDCRVSVSKKGFVTRVYRVRDLCSRRMDSDRPTCDSGSLQAELVAASSGGTPDAQQVTQ